MDQQPYYQETPVVESPIIKPIKKPKTVLWASIALIIGLAIGAAGIYVWQTPQVTRLEDDLKVKQEKVQQLEQQVSNKQATEDSARAQKLSDKETLSILTTKQVGDSTVGDYWLPVIHNVYQDYARTSPIPIKYSQADGYSVPAVGGMEYYWHKKDGKWIFIGKSSGPGYEFIDGYSHEKLPKELTK